MIDVLSRARESGLELLVGGARRGEYTMPRELVDAYTAMERVLEAPAPKVQSDGHRAFGDAVAQMVDAAQRGREVTAGFDLEGPRASEQATRDWHAARSAAAERLMSEAMKTIAWKGHRVIAEHIQPALAARVREFTADLATIGGWASYLDPPVDLLLESLPVRKAWHRWHHVATWYHPLRAAWAVLRRYDHSGNCGDPGGVDSLFAEVQNAPDVLQDWRTWRPGYLPKNGWQGTNTKVRLTWIVQHGGRIWAPTAVEQHNAYAPFAPKPLERIA